MSVYLTSNPDSAMGSHVSSGSGPGWNQAQGMGITPHPGIGASINYTQNLQNSGRVQNFAQGAQEGKTSGMPGGGGMHMPGGSTPSTGNGGAGEAEAGAGEAEAGAGDAAAGGAAEAAGAGLVEDAAVLAV
jgi:hypothetical protein